MLKYIISKENEKKIMLKFQIFYLIKIDKHKIVRQFSKGISKEQL